MKKYCWSLFIFFILIYVLPSLLEPITNAQCIQSLEAFNTYESQRYNLANLDLVMNGFFINLFGFNIWGIEASGILAVACLSLFMIFAIKKCTNDVTLALFSCLLFFTSFWCFALLPVNNNSIGAWGALTNFLGLGSYFMASREGRFSLQRINLLILCGLFTFCSLMINGLNPFFFSIIVVTIYMLAQKRYVDMILMPLIIASTTLILLCLESYYLTKEFFRLIIENTYAIISYWENFFYQSWDLSDVILFNLQILLLGIVPILIFVICSLNGYSKNIREFINRPIYKFSMVFLVTAIVFSILNKGLTIASLPITYIPFSFLVATGLIHYLRTSNKHRLLKVLIMVSAVILLLVGVNILLFANFKMQTFEVRLGLALLLAGGIILFTIKSNMERQIAAYFVGFAIILLSFATKKYDENILTKMEINSRLESIVGEDYSNAKVKFFATKSIFAIANFHLKNQVVLISDEFLAPTYASKTISTPNLKKLIENNGSTEIIVFDVNDNFELKKQAKTLNYSNLIIHYFGQ